MIMRETWAILFAAGLTALAVAAALGFALTLG